MKAGITAASDAPRARAARPITARAGMLQRFTTMAHVGLAMMFHDKLKLMGTMLGVVFAVILSNQQLGTFLGLLHKNTMLVKNAGADIWVMPPGTDTLQVGKVLDVSVLNQARTVPGVTWAEPLLYSAAFVQLPSGGQEPVTLLGTKIPYHAGGPWNLVQGDASCLNRPDTMIFEDSERDTLGGLNVGSVREVSGRKITVGGFTWGLIPFGPSFAFADFELARELTHTPSDQVNYVLVKVADNADIAAVKAELERRIHDAKVMSAPEFESAIIRQLLVKTPIGITFGTSALFGLIVGLVIVSLSMFSSVVDNIREFGTLKAVGARNLDLTMLLFVQSVAYGVIGSLIGLALVAQMAKGIRSAKLTVMLPPELTIGTVFFMVGMCVFASSLALLRLRKVEPGMVFR
jgi:putative ABC transport system permease protein